MTILGFLILISGVLWYFTPSIIASNRHKKNAVSIFVINLFFGWTLIGWVITLAWALAKD